MDQMIADTLARIERHLSNIAESLHTLAENSSEDTVTTVNSYDKVRQEEVQQDSADYINIGCMLVNKEGRVCLEQPAAPMGSIPSWCRAGDTVYYKSDKGFEIAGEFYYSGHIDGVQVRFCFVPAEPTLVFVKRKRT